MNILFFGDVVGRTGREAALAAIPVLKEKLAVDFLVVNGENSAGGFGITDKIAQDFYAAGTDVITTGNHVWGQRQIMHTIDQDLRLLRPINFPPGTPGRGAVAVTPKRGGKPVLVVNVMCRVFMEPLDDPFRSVDMALKNYVLGKTASAVIIDMHGEATSEKMAFGHYLDGRASLVVGTHTHVPTADTMILPKGTAYQTDAGMCGDYNSVIGMNPVTAIHRFTKKTPSERFEPTDGEATVCGTFVQTDDDTGLATRIEPVRLGGVLTDHIPTLA
ncbi:MAG: TIGR00282 family metallophosphoesterase [Alphaproteobacteria bacterium]|nr:TIGR00282 family metallophosphoesterase [Alphaproteobacteria bacterium]